MFFTETRPIFEDYGQLLACISRFSELKLFCVVANNKILLNSSILDTMTVLRNKVKKIND